MAKSTLKKKVYIEQAAALLHYAKTRVVNAINNTMVAAYFEVGKLIVEEEQNGKNRAIYGKQIITALSKRLTKDFGKGFSETNIKQMRQFYLAYSEQIKSIHHPIGQTLSDQFKNRSKKKGLVEKGQTVSDQLQVLQNQSPFILSWSHYLKLMRIENEQERRFYEIECVKNNWSLTEFQRQFDTALYTRLILKKSPRKILELSQKGHLIKKPEDAIKDPYILEFLDLGDKADYSENELEQKLINKLESFILELGKSFTFVARQDRITIDEKHFKIDLVFYNRILRCFVLIDLKIGELKHQDLGQMQMYVNYYDRKVKLKDENKTIGLVLCQDKSEAVVKYTLPESNKQIFASKYKTILPKEEALARLIENNS